jgi:hypothetical protein
MAEISRDLQALHRGGDLIAMLLAAEFHEAPEFGIAKWANLGT